MNEKHKKPTPMFWATLVLCGLAIVYIASFGPWCWIMGPQEESFMPSSFCLPILWVWHHSPSPLWDCIA